MENSEFKKRCEATPRGSDRGGKGVIDRSAPQPRQQSTSESDQASSNADQASSNADQRNADREQAAADRDLAALSSPTAGQLRAHEQATGARLDASMARVASAALRSQSAAGRDGQGQGRDASARQRDRAATRRDDADEAARDVELAGEPSEETPAAAAIRLSSTVARDRAAVARDRAGVGRDRAAVDREFAARDRELSTAEIERAFIDQSSGAYGRQLGEVILSHEIARTQGARGTLVLGIVRIDESEDPGGGSPAHPGLDRHLFLALQTRLRPFDAIARWSEQEFLCVLFDEPEVDARQRLEQACADLAKQHPSVLTGIGMASLGSEDTLQRLIDRAQRDF
ncbi:MAG TPA: hypothetical protein VMR96_00905 [Solirubrobacterales bacterium]|nr:hypothetical protein [Solirubrobacterales bacterium]